MEPNKPSLGERIDTLARCTSAPEGFVRKVRDLFSRKGIRFESSAEPFEGLLERVFARQAEAQRDIDAAKQNLERLQGHLAEIQGAFRDQIEQLRGMRLAVESQTRRLAASAPSAAKPLERNRMVRGEWDLPLVPGPDGDN